LTAKRLIFTGSGTAVDGKRLHLSVYRITELSFEFHVTGRGKHIYQPRTTTTPGMFAAEFADQYKLGDIKLEQILPTRSEGPPR
jgi:hypothetical protein